MPAIMSDLSIIRPDESAVSPPSITSKSKKITFPLNGADAKLRLLQYLYPQEHDEIEFYETIYFMNLFDRKASNDPPHGSDNNGFDNDNGEYLWRPHDHIAYRYEIKR